MADARHWFGLEIKLSVASRTILRGQTVTQEFRSAIRLFSTSPLFALTVLLTMALGIGTGAAVFSVVDTVLLRPLPYPDPERLVSVWARDVKRGEPYVEVAPREFHALRDGATTLSGVAAYSLTRRELADANGRPTRVMLGRVTQDFLPVLGASFAVGRGFSADEVRQEQPVLVLSHSLWTSRYGERADIVGQKVYIRQEPHEVIGVLTRDQGFPRGADLLRPLRQSEIEDTDREFQVLARLRDTATLAMAGDEAGAIVERLSEQASGQAHRRYSAWVQPLQSMLVKDARALLLLLLAAVALVVLMVCINIAGLLLARASSRHREMAMRSALGASRGRLALLCLVESLTLACAGGALGIGLGHLLLRAMISVVPGDMPRLDQVTLDARATAVMVAVTLVCGVLVGLVPAWIESRQDVRDAIAGAHNASARPRGLALRRTLVVAQVVLSTMLVAGATQVAAGFQSLLDFDRGFRNLSLMELQVSPADAGSSESIIALYDRIRTGLQSLPGVHSVEFANFSAMYTRSVQLPITIDGAAATRTPVRVFVGVVSPRYFETIGARLVEGRMFSPETDFRGATPVAIVNQAFVRALLPSTPPLGQIVRTDLSHKQSARLVGVIGDLEPTAQSVASPTIYLPFGQEVWPGMHVLIGMSTSNPSGMVNAIRERIWAVQPTLTIDNAGTLDEKLSRTLVTPRFNAAAVAVLASLALLLAAVGLYGLLSQFVSSRRRELAIRRAIGATERQVVLMVLRHALMLTLVGLALGLPAALGAGRLLSSSLQYVNGVTPASFAISIAVIGGVALLACLAPAFRAARTEPVSMLRGD